ncbi:MAG: ClbS/DfsB family four-helix bundle protein, partial [Actinomyces sp.]|nr:ClbS/DfsB family four-helix bundle protein [Actinomyces sp.]
HTAVVALIGKFTNEELFTKAHFSWTGTTSLGSYCVSATSSHYEWAIKKLRAFTRESPEQPHNQAAPQ